MQTKVAALLGMILLIGVAVSASAFTSATVERSAQIGVETDASGLIGLSPDTDATMVTTDGTGQLSIDMTNGGTTGVNVNSEFIVGDTSDPVNVSAFSVTNNDDTARNFTFTYSLDTDDGQTTKNVVFEVYDDTKASQGTFDEETGTTTITGVGGGAVHYVVLTVNTTDSTATHDLSGTLTIKAE